MKKVEIKFKNKKEIKGFFSKLLIGKYTITGLFHDKNNAIVHENKCNVESISVNGVKLNLYDYPKYDDKTGLPKNVFWRK